MSDSRPKILRVWKLDEPPQELYEVYIQDDGQVIAAYGRYALSSGHVACTWAEFLAGKINDVVRETQGEDVLAEVRQAVDELSAADQSAHEGPTESPRDE